MSRESVVRAWARECQINQRQASTTDRFKTFRHETIDIVSKSVIECQVNLALAKENHDEASVHYAQGKLDSALELQEKINYIIQGGN